MPHFNKTLLYYVHPHGMGHLQRARQLIPVLAEQYNIVLCTASQAMKIKITELFGSLPCHILPSKWPGQVIPTERQYNAAFEGISWCSEATERAAFFVNLLQRYKVDLFISDVSAELTILARGAGIPVLMQRHSGSISNDPTQVFAYQSAAALFAPYPKEVETAGYEFEHKTRYLGFSSPNQLKAPCSGKGMTFITANKEHLVGWLTCIEPIHGPLTAIGCEINYPDVECVGYVNDISQYITTDIVACSAGNNMISELLTLNKKLILIPEPRPYDEQHAKAQALAAQHQAVVLNPAEAQTSTEAWEKAICAVTSEIGSPPAAWLNQNSGATFVQLVKTII
ncbi:glycosyltransferase [Salinimonas lutimaris]|uniref:glycosyltransferase n=1 Tax=Salinimonas lutimaris TaxID=914153 RepID=UPI0010BFFB88|nr:glycosyltransferase [Salinimonas lutimaris]